MLPFVNVSIELAALVAGASLATFPGTPAINKRIRYIRDFFVTLYFVSLGMQIPYPTKHVFTSACTISLVALLNAKGLTLQFSFTLDRGVCTLPDVNKSCSSLPQTHD